MTGPASRAVAGVTVLAAALLVAAGGAFGGATDPLGRAGLALGAASLGLLAALAVGPARLLGAPRRAEGLALAMAGFALLTALPWPEPLARWLAPYAWASRAQALGTAGGVAPSLDAGATWRSALLLASLALFATSVRATARVAGPKLLLRALSLCGLVHAAAALARGRYAQDDRLLLGFAVDNPLGAYGTFPSRAQFSGYVLLLLGAAVGLAAGSRRVADRVLAGLTLGVGGAAVFASGSRAGMGGGAVLAATAWVGGAPAGARRRRTSWLALFLLAVAGLRLSGWGPLERALPLRGDEPKRLEIWQGSLALAMRQPTTGVGLQAFRHAYAGEGRGPGDTFVAVAENDALQWVAEMGIVGLVLGGLFVAAVVGSLRRARREGGGRGVAPVVALCGFAGVAPLSLTGVPLSTPAVAAAAILAWAAALGLVRGDDADAEGGYRLSSRSEAPWPVS